MCLIADNMLVANQSIEVLCVVTDSVGLNDANHHQINFNRHEMSTPPPTLLHLVSACICYLEAGHAGKLGFAPSSTKTKCAYEHSLFWHILGFSHPVIISEREARDFVISSSPSPTNMDQHSWPHLVMEMIWPHCAPGPLPPICEPPISATLTSEEEQP